MTKKLWAEDINQIVLDLCGRYPILTLSEEDQDVICDTLEELLDPYCEGYQNYN